MATEQIQIDPEGDVLIIVPVKRSAAVFGSLKSSESPTERRFICSKKHLTFASPRAAKIFSSSFKESTKEDDGFHHWKFDETFDDRAFDLVLKIIHGKTREVPQSIDLDLLVTVAIVVDDLQCHEALNYYGRGWISSFYGYLGATLPKEMNKTLVQHIFVSFVFEHEGVFQQSTKAAIRFNNGTVPTFELPIRADIPSKIFSGSQRLKLIREGHIENRRLAISGNLVNALKSLENRLLEGQLDCNHGCTSMLLGVFIQGMKTAGLYPPRALAPFSSLTLDFVIKSLRNLQSPTYFSAEKGSVAGKYSGSWTLSTRSNTAPPPTGFGGFGGQPQHDPAYLVRHSCSVKDLLKPLLDVAEAEIQGLKLADYSKS
ncbi:hypothetical protein BKA59DRAFT_405161 [Fusarium tricinctum]|uniref:BTB domain-containing protein n=1 Tax=Fusarium tricinctum TaxID=61284 RepID=A0A8K0W7M8_9HYPO|nr:hypothetical protein BKA59DRAFT_405161 [Fusarium tricinctum]